MAFADIEVDKLVNIRLVLKQDILACNADVGGSSLNIDRNVGGLHPEIPHLLFFIFKNELSVIFLDRGTFIACGFKHRIDLFAETPFRKRNVKHRNPSLNQPFLCISAFREFLSVR